MIAALRANQNGIAFGVVSTRTNSVRDPMIVNKEPGRPCSSVSRCSASAYRSPATVSYQRFGVPETWFVSLAEFLISSRVVNRRQRLKAGKRNHGSARHGTIVFRVQQWTWAVEQGERQGNMMPCQEAARYTEDSARV